MHTPWAAGTSRLISRPPLRLAKQLATHPRLPASLLRGSLATLLHGKVRKDAFALCISHVIMTYSVEIRKCTRAAIRDRQGPTPVEPHGHTRAAAAKAFSDSPRLLQYGRRFKSKTSRRTCVQHPRSAPECLKASTTLLQTSENVLAILEAGTSYSTLTGRIFTTPVLSCVSVLNRRPSLLCL